jgi:hypothetical protein
MATYNWKRNKVLNTHCPKGHEFTESNTFIRVYDNARVCKECRKEYARKKYQKTKLANGGIGRAKKEKQVSFEVPEYLELDAETQKMWYHLQSKLDSTPTPCTTTPNAASIWTDNCDSVTIDEAEQLCGGCPLLKQCYDFAVASDQPWGIWGGVIFNKEEMRFNFDD